MTVEGISVVICCFNSANRLPETIKHISSQKVAESIPWEVILVDNGSADNTTRVAGEEWSKYNSDVPFRIVQQPIPGLSAARQMGIASAMYEYLLFCDDDNWLDEDYISRAQEIMTKFPEIGALGGHGEPVFEVTPPQWFSEFRSSFALGPQGDLLGKVRPERNYVYGAGFVLRKAVLSKLKKAGFHSLLSDRKGNTLNSGGDVELCFAIILAGYEIWYNPELKFKHYITKDRLSWKYYMRLKKGIAHSFLVMEPFQIVINERMNNFQDKKELRKAFSSSVNKNANKLLTCVRKLFAQKFAKMEGNKHVVIAQTSFLKLYQSLFHYKTFKNNFYTILAFKEQMDRTN